MPALEGDWRRTGAVRMKSLDPWDGETDMTLAGYLVSVAPLLRPPQRMTISEDAESGRGLLLVEASAISGTGISSRRWAAKWYGGLQECDERGGEDHGVMLTTKNPFAGLTATGQDADARRLAVER